MIFTGEIPVSEAAHDRRERMASSTCIEVTTERVYVRSSDSLSCSLHFSVPLICPRLFSLLLFSTLPTFPVSLSPRPSFSCPFLFLLSRFLAASVRPCSAHPVTHTHTHRREHTPTYTDTCPPNISCRCRTNETASLLFYALHSAPSYEAIVRMHVRIVGKRKS